MGIQADIQEEISKAWEALVNSSFQDAYRLDISAEVVRAERQSKTDVRKHLTLWLAIFDEALQFLLLLNRLTHQCFSESDKKITRSFVMLLARIIALTIAIRRLVTSGLEDAARPVARSFIETMDLALVCLYDDDFARDFSAEGYDSNQFWKSHIGFGKLNFRLRRVLEVAGMDQEGIDNFFRHRAEMKGNLSDSVHSSLASAFRSMMIPSLSKPGRLSTSWLGHISAHSPGLLSLIILEVHQFGAVVVNSIVSDKQSLLFRDVPVTPDLDSVFASGLLLQQLVERYDEQLPPPFPWGEEKEL